MRNKETCKLIIETKQVKTDKDNMIQVSDEFIGWMDRFDKEDTRMALHKIKESYINKDYVLEKLSALRVKIDELENEIHGCTK